MEKEKKKRILNWNLFTYLRSMLNHAKYCPYFALSFPPHSRYLLLLAAKGKFGNIQLLLQEGGMKKKNPTFCTRSQVINIVAT